MPRTMVRLGPLMHGHKNNIGLLRLVFASLVIIGHSPVMVDGDYRREPLVALMGNMSLGTLAVDGFFVLSGYLITKSMLSKRAFWPYLIRRILRIYPAFILCSLLCVFVLLPATGGWPWDAPAKTLARMLSLQPVGNYPGQLRGLDSPHAYLNGPMWTIAYEFRCYILTLALWLCGILARPRWMLILAGLSLAALAVTTFGPLRALDDMVQYTPLQAALGLPSQTVRLTAAYLFGSAFAFYWPQLSRLATGRTAAVSLMLAVLLILVSNHVSELGLILFGGAALFWLALKADIGRAQAINDSWDISYGVYLYGWPIAIYLHWLNPALGPWELAALTLPLTFIAGALSWWGIEKWAKDLKLPKVFASRPADRQIPPERSGEVTK